MARSVVGLDIGHGVLRAAEVANPAKPRPTLLRYHEMSVPIEAVNRGEVTDPALVAQALKVMWSRAKFGTKDVVLGMGNQRVLSRDYSVRAQPLDRIRESLPFQVQDLLPVPVADALLDFYPISREMTDQGPMINGLLVAAIKEAVLGNVEAVEAAGLHVAEVDLIPFALTRLLLGSSSATGVTALVDIGASTTYVVLAAAGFRTSCACCPREPARSATRSWPSTASPSMTPSGSSGSSGSHRRRHAGAAPGDRHHPRRDERAAGQRAQHHQLLRQQPPGPPRHAAHAERRRRGHAGDPRGLRRLTRLPVAEADPFGRVAVADPSLRRSSDRPQQGTVAIGLAVGVSHEPRILSKPIGGSKKDASGGPEKPVAAEPAGPIRGGAHGRAGRRSTPRRPHASRDPPEAVSSCARAARCDSRLFPVFLLVVVACGGTWAWSAIAFPDRALPSAQAQQQAARCAAGQVRQGDDHSERRSPSSRPVSRRGDSTEIDWFRTT